MHNVTQLPARAGARLVANKIVDNRRSYDRGDD